MSLWWMWGLGSAAAAPDQGTPAPAPNAPSLWSGGVRWGDDDEPFGDGTDGFWTSDETPSRSGRPVLSVAIAGALVREQLRSADFGYGREDWLSPLSPATASFAFVDVPEGQANDEVVVGLMSDREEHHSPALWVGRVESVAWSRTLDGPVTSTVPATDVVGVLGRARAPSSIPAGHTLATLVERLSADAGVPLRVVTDPLATLATLRGASDIEGSVLELVNRAERSSNALLFLLGDGSLHAAVRDGTGASAVRVVTLDGPDSASSWSVETGLRGVVTRWRLGDGDLWSTDTAATTLGEYGEQAYEATDMLVHDPAPYADLISSDVMARPRPVLTRGEFPVGDMSQRAMWLNPLDRVVDDDGGTWQVMSVRHSVTLDEWRMSITADATQEALAAAPDPGPVEPPAFRTTTVSYASTRGAVAELTKAGASAGTGSGPLLVGRHAGDGSRYRSAVAWLVTPPANAVGIRSARARLRTAGETGGSGRMSVRRSTDAWSEGSMTWPGPHTTTTGERSVAVPRAGDRTVELSVTAIAREWWRRDEWDHGLRLAATNEDSTSRFCQFHSDDASDPDDRPRLTITWEVVS